MRSSQKNISKLIFLLVLLIPLSAFSQKRITVQASNLPLNQILKSVADEYNLRFAFDDDLFSQIKTSFLLSDVKLELFLNEVCNRYGLSFKQIAGTYVFYVDDKAKINKAIEATVKIENIKVEIKNTDTISTPIHHEHTLSGIVKNGRTGEKINFCNLLINGHETALTNEMGYFSQTFESDGKIELTIKHLGYQTLDTIVHTQNSMPLELSLDPLPLYLEPMQIRRMNMIHFLVDLPDVPEIITFNPQSTIQVPAVESNDLVNALTIIPGINYLKGTDKGLSIRGGAPSDNLVLLDGIPIIETSHLMGNLSVLNAKYIQQAFVSRGGFGAEYGGRTAGIVDLTGKSGSNVATVVDFTANLLHTNIYVGMPISDKVSLSGSFKKSFVDVWPSFMIDNFALENKTIQVDNQLIDDALVNETVINYSDANVKLSIRPNEHNELTFNFFDSFDAQKRKYEFVDIAGGYYQQNTNDVRTTGYSINQKTQSRKGWLNTFSVGYNKLNSYVVSENGKTPVASDQLVKTFFDEGTSQLQELRASWKSELKKKYIAHKFGTGYNYNTLQYNYQDREVIVVGANNFNDSISGQSQIQLLTAYYQAEIKPFKWIRFRAGVRGLYDLNNDDLSMQPRYGIELMPSSHLKFYYSTGRYLQHLYLTYRINSYTNASPIWVIPKQKGQNLDATHNIVGTRLEYSKFLLNIEGYLKRNVGKIYYFGDTKVVDGLEKVLYQQITGEEEVNRGLDIFMQYNTNIFNHLISYSLSESKERINGVNDGQFFQSFDDQLHRLRLTEIVSIKGWTASVNWYFANGMPYLLNSLASTQLNFAKLPNFMQLDVSLVKQFNFKYFYADLGISILNVLNHRNELSVLNYTLTEGSTTHTIHTTTTATAYSPLFYVNFRYE